MRRPIFRQPNPAQSETPKPGMGQVLRLSSRGGRLPRRAADTTDDLER
jgi:hypothetical protein